MKHLILREAKAVYIEYQRQLWDCGTAAKFTTVPTRQDHFHQFGPLGLYFLDLVDTSYASMGSNSPASESTPLLSSAHWHQLETVLREQNDVRVLLIVSECPVVADSPIDAAVKAKHIHCSHIKDTWSFHKDECLHLLDLIFAWKSAIPGRQAIFMCGGSRYGFTSTIYDTNAERHVSKETAGDLDAAAELLIAKTKLQHAVRQIVVGPVAAPPSEFFSEIEGTIDDPDVKGDARYTFVHGPISAVEHQFGIVRVDAQAIASSGVHGDMPSSVIKYRIRDRLLLHREARTKGLDIAMRKVPRWLAGTLEAEEEHHRTREERLVKETADMKRMAELTTIERKIEEELTAGVASVIEASSLEDDGNESKPEEPREVDSKLKAEFVGSKNDLAAGGLMGGITPEAALEVAKVRGEFIHSSFEKGVRRVYLRYAEENVGVEVDELILVLKNFFHKEARPSLKDAFPSPSDKRSCNTLIHLICQYALERREAAAAAVDGTSRAPIPLREMLSLVKLVFEGAAVLKPSIST